MQSKALVTLLATLGVAAVSHAQVAFQVAGPQNGATVRETVRIRLPRAAVENIKYLALAVDGKFRAGVAVPDKDAKVSTDLIVNDQKNDQVIFLWNTKAKVRNPDDQQILDGVDDGPHTLELTAYDASNKKVGKQTLTLTVNNRGDLRMPAEGISLAYRFTVGEENAYHQRTDLDYINEPKTPVNTVIRRSGNAYSSLGRGQRGGFAGGGMAGGGDEGGGGMMMGGPGGRRGGGSGSFPGGGMMGSGGMMSPGGQGGFPGGPGGRRGGGSGSFPGAGGGFPGGGGKGGGGAMGSGGGGMLGGGGMMGGGGGGGNPFGNGLDNGPYRIPVQTVKANYKRTTEDRLSSSEYFIRDRVEDGTIVASGGSARLQDVYNFKSRYRAVASSGAVTNPGIANGAHPGAYIALPFVDLGEGKRRVGNKWRTRAPLLLEWATLDVPKMVPVENTLVGLEWESGYQCARIEQHFEGSTDVPIFGGAGTISGAKVRMDRTIWFSYKAGKVIKMETTTEVEGDAPADILGAMVPQSGAGNAAMGGGMMGGGGMLGGGGGDEPGGMMGGGPMMGSGGMMRGGGGKGSGGPMMGSGGMMGGQGGFPGAGSGFGGMQSGDQVEAPKAPAKFRSVTVVELAPVTVPGSSSEKKS